MLKWRVISAVLGILILTLFIYWGSFQFYFFVSLLIIFGINEYIKLVPGQFRYNKILMMFLSFIFFTFIYLNNIKVFNLSSGIILIFTFFVLFINHLIKKKYIEILESISINIFGIIYIAGGFSFFPLLRELSLSFLWLALLATWATDTGAYFTGRFLGKRRLAKQISPNKTLEGAIGGIILTIITVLIVTRYIYNDFSFYWVYYSIILSVLAIAGDLFESSLRRNAEIKDSGSLIPGHGGILDRFDSLLFTVPFTYYFIIMLNMG